MNGKTILELDRVELGKRIRKERESLKLTREALSSKLMVSSKFIADIEYGEKGMSIGNFYKLTQILDVSADYLLAGVQPEDITEQREELKKKILEPLKECSNEQLEFMEKIAKYYAAGTKVKAGDLDNDVKKNRLLL